MPFFDTCTKEEEANYFSYSNLELLNLVKTNFQK